MASTRTRAARDPFNLKQKLPVDNFGVWLSQRTIRKRLPANDRLDVLELRCGLDSHNLVVLRSRLRRGIGID